MDLKNIFKKKTTRKNTFSEFESMSNENETGHFLQRNGKLKTVTTIASEPIKTKSTMSFLNYLKKLKVKKENVLNQTVSPDDIVNKNKNKIFY